MAVEMIVVACLIGVVIGMALSLVSFWVIDHTKLGKGGKGERH